MLPYMSCYRNQLFPMHAVLLLDYDKLLLWAVAVYSLYLRVTHKSIGQSHRWCVHYVLFILVYGCVWKARDRRWRAGANVLFGFAVFFLLFFLLYSFFLQSALAAQLLCVRVEEYAFASRFCASLWPYVYIHTYAVDCWNGSAARAARRQRRMGDCGRVSVLDFSSGHSHNHQNMRKTEERFIYYTDVCCVWSDTDRSLARLRICAPHARHANTSVRANKPGNLLRLRPWLTELIASERFVVWCVSPVRLCLPMHFEKGNAVCMKLKVDQFIWRRADGKSHATRDQVWTPVVRIWISYYYYYYYIMLLTLHFVRVYIRKKRFATAKSNWLVLPISHTVRSFGSATTITCSKSVFIISIIVN